MTLSDVRRERNEARDEVRSLNETMSSLQDKLLSSANKCSVLEDWLSELSWRDELVDRDRDQWTVTTAVTQPETRLQRAGDKLLSSANKCSVLEDWLGELSSRNDSTELTWKTRLETLETDKRRLHSRIAQLENQVC